MCEYDNDKCTSETFEYVSELPSLKHDTRIFTFLVVSNLGKLKVWGNSVEIKPSSWNLGKSTFNSIILFL